MYIHEVTADYIDKKVKIYNKKFSLSIYIYNLNIIKYYICVFELDKDRKYFHKTENIIPCNIFDNNLVYIYININI